MDAQTHATGISAFWSALATAEPPDLGPGPRKGVLSHRELSHLLNGLLRHLDGSQADLLKAAALLYHDQHDPAHDLVQDLASSDGVVIHAILHRREPDYWNAKYWFRRVTDHPLYRRLTSRLASAGPSKVADRWRPSLCLADAFDPMAMVEACESLADKSRDSEDVLFLRQIQQAEFECLVEHLFNGAAH